MADYNVKVIIDPAQAKRGGRAVRRELNSVENSADRLRKTITRTFSFLAAGAGIAAVTRTLATFSQEMSKVQAISRATGTQFMMLRDLAKDLGAKTRFSATEAARGMTELSKAGFSVDETMRALPNTLNLAQAAGIGLSESSGIVANTLRAFEIQASKTSHAVDVLGLASVSANTTVPGIAEALKYVGATAHGLGIPLEEIVATISAMAQKGIDASSAGTALNAILKNLAKPTKAFSAQMKAAGISTEDLSVTQRGFANVLETVVSSGISVEEALGQMDARAARAFGTLRTSIPFVRNLTKSLGESDGTIKEMAKTMDDNLNGALLATKSALEAVVIAFGELGAESILTRSFRGLAATLRALAANFGEVTGVVLTGATAWAAYFTAIKIGTLSELPSILAKIAGGIRAINTALLSSPIAAIAAAITAVIGLLITFRNKLKLSADSVATLGDLMAVLWNRQVEGMRLVHAGLKKFAKYFPSFKYMFRDLDLSFSGALRGIARFIDYNIAFWTGLYYAVVDTFEVLPLVIKRATFAAMNAMVRIIENKVHDLITKSNKLLSSIHSKVRIKDIDFTIFDPGKAATGAKSLGETIMDGFVDGLDNMFLENWIVDIIDEAEAAAQKRAIAGFDLNLQGYVPAPIAAPAAAPTITPTVAITEQNAALEAQKKLFEQIKAPIEEYTKTLAAADALFKQEKISRNEYKAALRQTQLGGEFQQLQLDLMPEYDAQLATLEQSLQQRTDLIQQFHEARIISEQETADMLLAVQKRHNAEVVAAESNRVRMQLNSASQGFGAMASITKDFVGEQSRTYKSLFALSKGFAVASTTVAIAQGIGEAAKAGWPEMLPKVAGVLANTAGLISQIKGTQFSGGYQTGGSFRVGGSGGADSQLVAFRATPNETVSVRTPSQQRSEERPTQQQQSATLTKVYVTDPNMVQDYLGSDASDGTLVRAIERNSSQIKQLIQ